MRERRLCSTISSVCASDIAHLLQYQLLQIDLPLVIIRNRRHERDLAVGLRTPIAEAERIKRQYGRALQSLVDTEDMIDVQGVGGKEIQPTSRKLIGEIIECRVEEIFALALQRIQHYDLSRDLSAGAVITGGASVMPGMMQAAETILELPVRLGLPAQISGLTDLVNTPMYATAVGLALCGKDRLLEAEAHRSTHPGIAQAFQRIVAWVHNFF